MGWQDDPVVSDVPTPAAPPSPQGAVPGWQGDPVVPSAPTEAQATPEPSMGQVAANAVPKGIANFLNTPMTLANLIMQGIASLPGAGHLTGLQEAAANPELKQNAPMDAMRSVGLVKPENEPQTGPQRIVDMAIQTAIGSAVVPGGGVAGAVKGAVIGATSGAAAQTTKELTGSDLLAAAVGMATPFVMMGVATETKHVGMTLSRKQTLQDAQAIGYVVEPSSVRSPTSKLETVAGKASIAQAAVVKNQSVTNLQAAKALGLEDGTQFSPSLLDELKKRVEKPYQDVEALRASATDLPWFTRYHSANLSEELKQARTDTTALYKSYYANPDPGVLKAAKASASMADSIESDIEMIAKAAGKPELIDQLRAARQYRARIADVEMALNVGDGNISAPIIGRMLDKGRPLSGELAVVGRFAQAYPRVAREVAGVPPAGVSGTDAAASALLAAGGAAAAGGAEGAATGLLPLLRSPARNKVLSKSYQDNLLRESAKASTVTTASRAGLISTVLEGNREQEQPKGPGR